MSPATALSTARDPWVAARAWIAIQELPKHLANVLPFLLGCVLVWWATGAIDWTVFWVSLVALYLVTNGTYIANEYFDYENDLANVSRLGGADTVGVTTTGGTRVLVRGLIPRRHALVAAIACFVLAVPVGLLLPIRLGTGPLTIPLGAVAIFIGWFYTAPPIRACYRGLGELFIAVGQGLVVFGAYYVQAGWSTLPLVASLPWFVALPALKIIRQFPDFDADLATDKRGLVIRFGRDAMARVYVGLVVVALLGFVPVGFALRSPALLLALVPVSFLARSAALVAAGRWRDRAGLEQAAASGFVGMLLIPVALAAAFLVAGLLG